MLVLAASLAVAGAAQADRKNLGVLREFDLQMLLKPFDRIFSRLENWHAGNSRIA